MNAQEAKAIFEQAVELCRTSELRRADVLLKQLEQAYPESPQVVYLRGLWLAGRGRTKAAQAVFFKLQAMHGDGAWTAHLDAVPAARSRFGGWHVAAAAVFLLLCAGGAAAYFGMQSSRAGTQAAAADADTDDADDADDAGEPPVERAPASFENAQVDPVPVVLRMVGKEELFRFLGSPDTRPEAMALLGENVTADDLPALRKLLQDPDHGVRCCAACLIGYKHLLGGTQALLEALAQDRSHYVRREAAQALGRLNLERAVDALEQSMLYDPSTIVRKQAAWAFGEIAGRNGIERLQAALQRETSDDVRLTLRWMTDVDFKITRAPAIVPGQPCYGSYLGALYRVYVPARPCPGERWPVLVSVHGTDGSPEGYLDMWCADAEKYGFVVIAPYFDAPVFPAYDRLNINLGMERSDVRLLKILDAVAEIVPLETGRFYLFGHSKGGQFVSRFVLAHPDRILRAAACGSGNYVAPEPTMFFPEGTKKNPLAPDLNPDFGQLLRTDMAVIIGTEDLERRRQAAQDFMKAVNTYARTNKVKSNVLYITVNKGRHLGTDNCPVASQFFFRDVEAPAS